MGRELPRQVHGVGNACVHAVAGVGHPKMGRVTTEEQAPVLQVAGDEAAALATNRRARSYRCTDRVGRE